MTRSARPLHTPPLLLLALLVAAWQTPACSEVSCEETRTCGGPPAPVTAGEGGDTSGSAANPQGGSGNGAGRVTAAIGDACPTDNARACPGPASSSVLLCDDGLWTLLRDCSAGERCDSRDPECEPVVPACASLAPNAAYCDASTLYQCGPDKVTTTPLRDCPQGCAEGACIGTSGAGGDSGMPASEGGTAGTGDAVPSDAGTAGATPIDPENPCSAEPCEHGSCAVVGGTYECTCEDGYEGDNCETNVNDCAPNPCENGGRCDDLVAGYECVCAKTFTGVNCEVPRFQLLGALAGDDASRVWDMTPDGAVLIGTSRNSSKNGTHAFRWTNGVMEMLPRRAGEEDSFVAAITPDGATIVGVSEGATDVVGYRVDAGKITYLPPLTNGVLASVYDVSADGRVVVGYSYFNHASAVRWIGAIPESLEVPNYMDAVDSQARAANADGTIIFGNRVQGPPFVWAGGEVTNLPVPGASPNCSISGASEEGDVAIGYCSGENAYSAVRWTGSTLEELDAPPEQLLEQPRFQFDGVSRNATAAAGFAESTAGRQPIIWDSIHGMRWLRIVLQNAGIDTSEWDNIDAAAISDDGRIVAGAVIGSDQKSQAFVARLP